MYITAMYITAILKVLKHSPSRLPRDRRELLSEIYITNRYDHSICMLVYVYLYVYLYVYAYVMCMCIYEGQTRPQQLFR